MSRARGQKAASAFEIPHLRSESQQSRTAGDKEHHNKSEDGREGGGRRGETGEDRDFGSTPLIMSGRNRKEMKTGRSRTHRDSFWV